MGYDPDIHHRRSIRLKTHDYAGGGVYYLTLGTHERRRIFGTVVNGRMALNDAGRMVRDEWLKSAEIRKEIALDEWVVMPEHFHAIVLIKPDSLKGDPPVSKATLQPRSLGALVAGFKSASGKGINQIHQTPGARVWHRNYYEHIVRDDADLHRIRRYILANPANYDHLRFGAPRFIIGNPALLDLPKTAFLASRPKEGDAPPGAPTWIRTGDRRVALSCDRQVALSCIMSGFLSPMERSVFQYCLSHDVPMIQVLARGLPNTFPPQVRNAIDSGRLLMITPFAQTITHVNSVRAAWCNQYLLHEADDIIIGHLNPDGMLDCLLSDLPLDKSVIMLNQ